ncbi:hypothetical protein DIPPA_16176 [Diplonema papillatum]|nr:hypothetical protein DIPPA_16176 [Diplonema papillatum]
MDVDLSTADFMQALPAEVDVNKILTTPTQEGTQLDELRVVAEVTRLVESCGLMELKEQVIALRKEVETRQALIRDGKFSLAAVPRTGAGLLLDERSGERTRRDRDRRSHSPRSPRSHDRDNRRRRGGSYDRDRSRERDRRRRYDRDGRDRWSYERDRRHDRRRDRDDRRVLSTRRRRGLSADRASATLPIPLSTLSHIAPGQGLPPLRMNDHLETLKKTMWDVEHPKPGRSPTKRTNKPLAHIVAPPPEPPPPPAQKPSPVAAQILAAASELQKGGAAEPKEYELNVPPEKFCRIIGKGGAKRKEIEAKWGVTLRIPSREASAVEKAYVIGGAQVVLQAKEDIEREFGKDSFRPKPQASAPPSTSTNTNTLASSLNNAWQTRFPGFVPLPHAQPFLSHPAIAGLRSQLFMQQQQPGQAAHPVHQAAHQTFTDHSLMNHAAWLPEYMNELLDSHQILEATARYVYKTQKEASEEGKKAFLAAITLLSVVVKAAAGLQKTSILREVAVVHPILRWWRRVSSPEFEGARRELPKSAVTFNRLLYDLVTCDAALLTEIRAEDFALIEASFLRAGPRDSEALQKFRENDAIRVAARIILFLYSAEDFRVITSLADAKWVYKLARVVRPATWNSRRTFNVNGALVSSILRGACAFSNRWSVQVAQAELPKIAVDKLRLSLGFTMLAIREKMASKKEMVQQAEPVIEACIMFLGEFARGELTEQQYAASAYNSERVGVLRHSRLVGMLSHALRLYPSSENMAADIVSILLVLLRYEEQIYDIRDSNMVQSLTIARSHMPNATAQTRILRILKVIQEQMPM